MNAAFADSNADGFAHVDNETVEAFRPHPETSLVDGLRKLVGSDMSEAIYAYVDAWPGALKRAAQAVIWENFTREARVPITFAWTPGYDYSVTIYDVVDTETSRGGITVLFTSRYPADEHPLRKVSGS